MNTDQDVQRRKRKRRRKRRLVAISGFIVITTGLAWFFELQATTTIIVTRHADQMSLAASNAGLSVDGGARAKELARVLADVDVVAGIDAIFVTPDRSARDTGVPLAMLNEAPVHTVEDPADVEGLVEQILNEYKGKIILVITHPEHIQPVIAEMAGSKKLPPMAHDEYDNLYIVSIPWFGKVKTLRLRYGVPHLPVPVAGE
ncbi:MAG: hypothetical protein QF790_04835 [Gammaproteobacteria bacterium]|jgi:hypothetical protein|nr:hypothetical protein [Gammaproteobacteria bacterium]MDP6616474.1 hypothetical protein [Gammaproteobacteria bacterium]MDP6694278.1 hypothetical protein [Gammaproteobacteria bacterium]MDP7041299.1 hypothetical protein [Gammaproteobacteria bacterium]